MFYPEKIQQLHRERSSILRIQLQESSLCEH